VELDEYLFRREYPRVVAALTGIFGFSHLELAEDVAQDAFCRALDVWKLRGVPANPSAWLMTVAKRRAIDVIRRERTARAATPELAQLLESEWTLVPTMDEHFTADALKDDQLRMMFSCCQPRLKEEVQIALVLHLCCGFSAGEVASAFLEHRSAVEKRLTRAKKALAASRRLFDLDDRAFTSRLEAVQRATYLLFNEGYHGASASAPVRTELCNEAMRLGDLLLGHPLSATPATYALCALMHLHAARLPARVGPAGELTSLYDQDRSRWDREHLARGRALLERSAVGSDVSEYHVEAAIAAVHTAAAHAEDTDWLEIARLYEVLMEIRPSPVVALNHAIAIAQAEGPERGLEEIKAIAGAQRLSAYPFYSAALGEFELRSGRPKVAVDHFRTAVALARSNTERRFFERRVRACEGN
jgi:RNA polymerase sigma factor (sigma-70 family)